MISQNSTPKRLSLKQLPWSELVLFVGLIIAFAWMSQLSPKFLTARNLFEVTRFAGEVGLIALGMTLVIITGGIDLSVGAVLGLSGIVLGMLFQAGMNIWLAVAVVLVLGLACGLLNGFVTAYIGIPPLIVTLATTAVFRGLALGLSQAESFGGYPEAFYMIGQGYVARVPVQFIVLVVVAVGVAILLSRHTVGRFIYAIGNNAQAAKFAGVPVQKTLLIVYGLCGVLASLAGVVFTSRVSSARADAGLGIELDAITAVVLGGTAILGGSGNILGTLLGLLLVSIIRNGLNLAFVPSEHQAILIGITLLVAVLLNQIVANARRAR
jgi:rhamnose transport system permease protein